MSDALMPTRWIAWGRSLFALVVVGMLLALGVANIAQRAQLHQVEDGVLWADRAEGVTAVEVAAASPAASAGIQRGDIILAINGAPIERRAEVEEYQRRGSEGTRLSYTLARLGTRQAVAVSLALVPHSSSMYFVLAAVGLVTLLVGGAVRLRRPGDQATLHFFWLCVAFFGAFTFSFNGPLDRLDWVFFWGDAVAMALVPPLLLHFTLEFPDRPARRSPNWTDLLPIAYVPALALIVAKVVLVTRGAAGGQAFSRSIDLVERAEHAYLVVCAMASLGVLIHAFRQITSETGQRPLRWIAWGTALGVGAFAVLYALPWAIGMDPPLALQLTAIPLCVVPLTF